MAELVRSNILGIIEEDTEGTLKDLTSGSEFIPLREGFSVSGEVETIESDNLIAGDIGKSKTFVSKQTPISNLPLYLKGSGTEGVAPEFAPLIKSAMGSQTDNSTEYSVTSGSNAGDSSSRATLAMASDEEDNFVVGQAVLIKDTTNNYSIRNIYNVDSANGELDLNFNLSNAPASGIGLGKAIFFKGATTHPTFSLHNYHALTNSAFKQAIAGCRTTNMAFSFPANNFAELTTDIAGINFHFDAIRITSANQYLDFSDGTERNAQITIGVYDPISLAVEIQTKMDALTSDNITVSYSSTTGKFTIASDGATLSLLWNTGTNTANTIGGSLGFTVSADDTGALTYTSDSAIGFEPSYTPSYDDSDKLVIKGAQLMIGNFYDNFCRKAREVSFTIGTPKTDVDSICATSGIDSSIITERTVEMTAQLILQPYEAQLYYDLLNNVTTQVMFNAGPKSAGNWVAGRCFNIWLANASITAVPIAETDGYHIVNLTASAFVGASLSDVYMNFL